MLILLATAGLLAIVGFVMMFKADDYDKKVGVVVMLMFSLTFAFGAGYENAGRATSCKQGIYQLVTVARADVGGGTVHLLVRNKDQDLRLFAVPSANLHFVDGPTTNVRLTTDKHNQCHGYAE